MHSHDGQRRTCGGRGRIQALQAAPALLDGPAAAQVYTRLNERLGLSDHLMVLNVMLAKIATNLKAFGSCEEVVEQTLNLFQARGGAGAATLARLFKPFRPPRRLGC